MISYSTILHYYLPNKEGYNRGHGLSAAIKLGSLEKTVGASLTEQPFFVEKTTLHN